MGIEDFSDEPVIHDPEQLRSPSELVSGGKYYIRNNLPFEKRALGNNVRIVSLDKIGEGFVVVENLDIPIAMLVPGMKCSSTEKRSLIDTGLMPYSEGVLNGKWNPNYWWVRE